VKGKTVIAILAAGMFLFALWLSALGFSYGKAEFFDSQKTLINEKAGVASVMESPLLGPDRSELAGECRNQPMLVGMLLIFIAVSACGVGFVCHLFRRDDLL
jgi:hypothetical protein